MRTRARFAFLFASFAAAGTCAQAQWTADPASPVVAGRTLPSGLDRPAIALAPDGSTWHAWVDDQCFGALRAQRIDGAGNVLVDGGVHVETLDACASTLALLAVSDDGGAIVARADFENVGSGMREATISRLASDGSMAWGDPIVLPSEPTPTLGGLHALAGGDVLVVWQAGTSLWVARHDSQGAAVWEAPTEIPTLNGSSMRILGMCDDGAGGAYIVWDLPFGAYLRRVRVARINADGSLPWGTTIAAVSGNPESSRHSVPAFAPDGLGGVVVFYTEGRESAGTIADLLMQRVAPNGDLVFLPSPARISLGVSSQFDPRVAVDPQSGDFLIAWRDNVALTSALRAQRMGIGGERRWGDTGVEVVPLGGLNGVNGAYDSAWDGSRMLISLANAPGAAESVVVHRLDAGGAASPDPWVIADGSSATRVRIVPTTSASIVSWIRDDAGIPDSVVAQRVNATGQLGPASLLGDLNGDCVVNFTDLNGVLGAFGSNAASGDANGDGVTDFADLNLVLSNFGLACGE